MSAARPAPPHLARILELFDNVRPTGNEWSARCPAHKDRKNSLSLGIGDDGAVVVHCHAGCDPGMVLYHKGLMFTDLYPPRGEATVQNGRDPRASEPTRNNSPGADTDAEPSPTARVIKTTHYEIRDPSGDLTAVHVRRDFDDGTKDMPWERPDGRPGLDGKPVADLPLFGIHKLGNTPWVVVTEGEKAAQALRELGVAAVGTVTGAKECPSDDSLRPLLGFRVALWPDRDDAGEDHMDRIAQRLKKLGLETSKLFRVEWPDAPAKGDAADYVARGGTRESFRALAGSAQPWQSRSSAGASSPGSLASASGAAAGHSPSSSLLGKPPSQATRLVALAHANDAELFHDDAGQKYISFSAGGHRETHPVRSSAVREWLAQQFYDAEDTAPNGTALRDAVQTLEGQASYRGQRRSVFVRVAGDDDAIFLDLADDAWRVVAVTATGWEVIPAAACPVRFRRPNGLLALPLPVMGGSVNALKPLINVKSDDDFALVVAWLVGVLRPRGPFPILSISGEQGAAKSSAARALRSLLDPNILPLRTMPREEGDLLIAATRGLICCFDNVSSLPEALSDALCRLATGGGLGKRTLITDQDETLLAATRPILLTSIESALTRGDAIDRALLVELASIPKAQRRTEAELHADLDAIRPQVLGALLTAASTALRNWPTTRPENLPRMADFGRWVEAAAPALGWPVGTFLRLYDTNRDEADELVVESDPIGPALLTFLAAHGSWSGTADDLLTRLNEQAGEKAVKAKEWPKSARGLSGRMKRIAPNLRRLGYVVETGAREAGTGRRLTTIAKESGSNRHTVTPSQIRRTMRILA